MLKPLQFSFATVFVVVVVVVVVEKFNYYSGKQIKEKRNRK